METLGDSVQGQETTQIKAQNTESSYQAWEISTSSAGLQCSLREIIVRDDAGAVGWDPQLLSVFSVS